MPRDGLYARHDPDSPRDISCNPVRARATAAALLLSVPIRGPAKAGHAAYEVRARRKALLPSRRDRPGEIP
jgi:hypothetical protein